MKIYKKIETKEEGESQIPHLFNKNSRFQIFLVFFFEIQILQFIVTKKCERGKKKSPENGQTRVEVLKSFEVFI